MDVETTAPWGKMTRIPSDLPVPFFYIHGFKENLKQWVSLPRFYHGKDQPSLETLAVASVLHKHTPRRQNPFHCQTFGGLWSPELGHHMPASVSWTRGICERDSPLRSAHSKADLKSHWAPWGRNLWKPSLLSDCISCALYIHSCHLSDFLALTVFFFLCLFNFICCSWLQECDIPLRIHSF